MRFGGRWEAFVRVPSLAAVAASNSGGSDTPVPLVAGLYLMTAFCAHLEAQLNATRPPATWTVTLSTGINGTGLVAIDCTGETWSLDFSTIEVGELLGFAGDIASTTDPAIATSQCAGLWFPEAGIKLKTDPWRAPKHTDARSTMGPNGQVTTYVSASWRQHSAVRYTQVPRARIFEGEAATPRASLEQWLDDTQLGDGHAWFDVGSAFQIYSPHQGADRIVGYDLNAGAGPSTGWHFETAIASLEDIINRSVEDWLGLWMLELPAIVAEG